MEPSPEADKRVLARRISLDLLGLPPAPEWVEAFLADSSPEAYERLLLDSLRGDPSLFTRSDEVEYSWRFISSLHQGWAALPRPAFPNYYPFTDGPDEAQRLLEGTTARWRSLDEM